VFSHVGISTAEFASTELKVWSLVQGISFKADINTLRSTQTLAKQSVLRDYNPWVDDTSPALLFVVCWSRSDENH
jgi:hypothetical protein